MGMQRKNMMEVVASEIETLGFRDDEEELFFTQEEVCHKNIDNDFTIQFRKGMITGFTQGSNCSLIDLCDSGDGVILPACDWIDTEAFSSCSAIRSLTIQNRLYHIGARAFSGCENLSQVTLPKELESVPMGVFSRCINLEKIQLPQTLKSIAMLAFNCCVNLSEINLPESLEKVENYAFYGCRSLTEISLPDSLVSLGEDALANCTGLKHVRLGSGLKKIESCSFQNCVSLEMVEIPEGITEIGLGAFSGCTGLKRIILPESLKKIHPYAFYGCTALEAVECCNPSRYEDALCTTPFWRKRYPHQKPRLQVPMDLLNIISGEVDALTLSARGYTWFDPEDSCRIFTTEYPDVWKVCVWSECSKQDPCDRTYRYYLMNGNLEPVSGAKREESI